MKKYLLIILAIPLLAMECKYRKFEFAPTINVDYFPNTVNSYYWTASANAFDQRLAWFVYFGSGYEYYDLKTAPFAVRLVRGHI